MKHFKEFINEIYGRSARNVGRGISQATSRGRTDVFDPENMPEHHQEQIHLIRTAMEKHPSGSESIRQSQLNQIEHHKKKYNALVGKQ